MLALVYGLKYVGVNLSVIFTAFLLCSSSHGYKVTAAAVAVFLQEQKKAVKGSMFQSIYSHISLAGTVSHGHL